MTQVGLELAQVVSQMVLDGKLEDAMIMQGGASGTSIRPNGFNGLRHFGQAQPNVAGFLQAVQSDYNELVIKQFNKVNYNKPIYLESVLEYKVNRKSIEVHVMHRYGDPTGGIDVIKIKLV